MAKKLKNAHQVALCPVPLKKYFVTLSIRAKDEGWKLLRRKVKIALAERGPRGFDEGVSKSLIVKAALIALGLALLAGGGLLTASVYQRVQKFSVEDQIHGTFFPVVDSLHAFQEETGSAAQDLGQLVPKYLPEIPKSELVDKITYTPGADGKGWKLTLYSTALKPPRTYNARSKPEYSEEEMARIITIYHQEWHVLRE